MPSSKMHILADANRPPFLVGVAADNTHDSEGLKAMRVPVTVHPSVQEADGASAGRKPRSAPRGDTVRHGDMDVVVRDTTVLAPRSAR